MVVALAVARSHMLAANYAVYRVAAEAALAGEDFYAVAPERFPEFTYLYPPISVVAFLPFAFVGLRTGFAVHTALEVGVALALAWVLVRWIERTRPLARLDRLLIAGFAVASIHSVPSLVYGQVNLRTALLVALGLWLLERSTDEPDDGSLAVAVGSGPSAARVGSLSTPARLETLAGVALAGAALLKVFPAAIGIWLVRRRAWRAVAGAIATGFGGLALGAAVFGLGRTRQYFGHVLLERTDEEAFVGGLDPSATYVTVARPLSALAPDLDPTVLSALAVVVVLPPLAYVYTDVRTPIDRLVAAHATLLAIFVALPSYPLYYPLTFATLAPALYLVRDPPTRRLLVAGALLANVVVMGPTLGALVSAAPPPLAGPLETVGFAVLRVASPMLLGCLVMLAGCVRHRYRRGRTATSRTARPRGPRR